MLGFYIIKGEDCFSNYNIRFYYRGPLNGNLFCKYSQYSNSPYGYVSYKFDGDDDNVYFIWESEDNQIVSANFSLALNVYDTISYRLQNCRGICDFNLSYGSKQVVLINSFDFLKNSTTSSFTVTRNFRFSTWFSLGLGLTAPFALTTILIFFYYLVLKFRKFYEAKRWYIIYNTLLCLWRRFKKRRDVCLKGECGWRHL